MQWSCVLRGLGSVCKLLENTSTGLLGFRLCPVCTQVCIRKVNAPSLNGKHERKPFARLWGGRCWPLLGDRCSVPPRWFVLQQLSGFYVV